MTTIQDRIKFKSQTEGKKDRIKITFDSNPKTTKFVWDLISGLKIIKKCNYCGKKLTKDTVGIITRDFMVCQSIICLIEFNENNKK